MNPARIYLLAAALLAVIVYACGVIKNDDHEKDVREFLTAFETSLQKPAPAILNEFFQTTQDKGNIFQALNVLQNRDSSGVKCKPSISLAAFTFYEKRIEARIPVSFAENGIAESDHINTETQIVFWLERVNGKLKIVEVDGSAFYQTYTAVKNFKQWSEIYKKEVASREPFYQTARELEQKFDTVIWYANVDDKQYYYAVSGSWENYFLDKENSAFEGDYKMGLINSKGDTLIPFEYELIGTIGFIKPSIVEVKKDGKYGYFDLDSGKLVVDATYDMIIPYAHEDSDAKFLVLQDTTYGWLSPAYAYTEGYPSQHAIDFAFNYAYLQHRVVLKAGNQNFAEIPLKDHIGYGIIVPPSYYVNNKIFDQIVGGINTTAVPMNGWTDYIESAKSMVARIGEGIHAIISVLSERYIGGREEFYGASQVTFVNEDEEVMGTTEMPTDQEVEFQHIEGILELKASSTGYYYWTPGGERDIPVYKYFQIVNETELTELESKRIFNFTEFVKIDSAYITGSFAMYQEEVYEEPAYEESTDSQGEAEATEGDGTEEEVVEEDYGDYYEYEEPTYNYIDMLTLATLKLMRDEIGAANGLRPSDSENVTRFQNQGFTMPYNSFEEIQESMSEIDRYNWDFLNRVIDAVQAESDENAI